MKSYFVYKTSFDSDFEVYVNLEEDNNEEYLKMVEHFILTVLYSDNGLISKYTYRIDENGKLVD